MTNERGVADDFTQAGNPVPPAAGGREPGCATAWWLVHLGGWAAARQRWINTWGV
jgi:hypothetical protein